MPGPHRPSAAVAGVNANPKMVTAQKQDFFNLTTLRCAPNGCPSARGDTGPREELRVGECQLTYKDCLSLGSPVMCPRGLGLGTLRRYLAFEEEPTFLLKLAERDKATSISGTSTTTCGLCTKPRPLCTPTCRRRSRTSRAPASSGLPA